MLRKLSSSWIVLVLAAFALVTSALVWAYNPVAAGSLKSPVKWDDRASKELTHEFHALHEASNRGDYATVKKLIAGDDLLVTFELGSDQTPVPLRSKKEIDSFLDRIVKEAANDRGTYELEMPKMNCRATETFGVCTEECTIHYTVDGVERIDKSFGTGVAVKYPDGWKFIQYHMSVAAPSETRKAE
ncbi:MAG TPA: nuclear transport factor 2 family protein [Pyrinomonadaceae bacterium]|jgi:hypothetical protein|nr:nuclear transport factor 2 family protein [Pyrinomonadaceae bacterium]